MLGCQRGYFCCNAHHVALSSCKGGQQWLRCPHRPPTSKAYPWYRLNTPHLRNTRRVGTGQTRRVHGGPGMTARRSHAHTTPFIGTTSLLIYVSLQQRVAPCTEVADDVIAEKQHFKRKCKTTMQRGNDDYKQSCRLCIRLQQPGRPN